MTEQMQIRLKGLIGEVCSQQGINIIRLEIKPNFVYLHCDMPPMEAVNVLVRRVKRKTSSVLCREFPELCSRLPSLWTLHYFISTQEEKPEKEIQEWILTQPRCQKEIKQTGKGRRHGNDRNKLDRSESKLG